MGKEKQRPDLRRLLQERLEKPEKQMSEEYFTEMEEKIFKKVYNKRYAVYGGTKNRVNQDDFCDRCWEMLEQGRGDRDRIILKLGDQLELWKQDKNDSGLRRRLWKIFKNELQQMIYDSRPGLRSRFKQLEVILPEIAVKLPHSGRSNIWYLTGKESELTVSAEDVISAADNLTPPQRLYSRRGERGPQISNEEMKSYLRELLESLPGSVRQSDIQSLLVKIYSLQSVIDDNHKNSEEDTAPESLIVDPASENDWLPSELRESAEAIVKDMDERLRRYSLLIMVEELSQTEAAERLKVSNATTSGLQKRLKEILTAHMEGLVLAEGGEVIKQVKELLANMQRFGKL
jgi:predicted DNA-binding protein (UPF0251 family)